MRILFYALCVLGYGLSTASAEPVRFSGNGHYYELVSSQLTWDEARAAASVRSHAGEAGYLATITSASENEFLDSNFNTGNPSQYAWFGGHEPADDGIWLWGDGPEQGVQFANWNTPTAPDFYVNWGGIEPNDFAPGENYAAFNIGQTFLGMARGTWIDSPNPNPDDPINAYLVEYGAGMSAVGPTTTTGVLLSPNHPNPFNPQTTIAFELPAEQPVSLCVYDVSGRLVNALLNDELSPAGRNEVVWRRRDEQGRVVPAGVYFYRLEAGGYSETKRMVLIK
jgi:hypothetical protein